MQRLYREGEQKRALLNLAIRRLAIAEKRTQGNNRFFLILKYFDFFNKKKKKLKKIGWEHEQRILNWERLYLRMSEAKGQGRRWRFRVEGVRKKAEEGYDELVKWINTRDGYAGEEEETDSQEDDEMDERNGASHIDREDDEIDLEGDEEIGEEGDDRRVRKGRGGGGDRIDRSELQKRRSRLMGGGGGAGGAGPGGAKKKRPGRERYDDDLSNLSVDLDRKSDDLDGEDFRPRDRKKKSPRRGKGRDGEGAEGGDDVKYDSHFFLIFNI